MANESLSKTVEDLKVMSGGITTRLASLTSINIVADDAEALDNYATQLETLNTAQENLKAELLTKTAELMAVKKEAKAKQAALAKRIKLVTPPEHWPAFGITAKR